MGAVTLSDRSCDIVDMGVREGTGALYRNLVGTRSGSCTRVSHSSFTPEKMGAVILSEMMM
jgi:hypothetical protein